MNQPRLAAARQNGSTHPFGGFATPTSNTSYIPNQFFDVCLRHRSRGCVRVVAYLLRQTLGWSDSQGRPLRERFTFSYATLIKDAGVGRDSIRAALAEAEQFHFIRCLRRPAAYRSGATAQSGLYELKWDESSVYHKDPGQFRGFFAGEGNRTYIPNEYFDVVVRQETLAIAKVVGGVARFSIGFATKWGHRRQHVALSFSDLSRYANLSDRTTLSSAIRIAIARHYLVVIAPGVFDPNAGQTSTATTYAIRWIDASLNVGLNRAADSSIGRKTRTEKTTVTDRSEIQTGNGRKTRPDKQSENQTGIQITFTNNTLKQQDTAAAFEMLVAEGFDGKAARALSTQFDVARVDRQIRFLPRRNVKRNRLGLLRSSIEQDWPAPLSTPRSDSRKLGAPNSASDRPSQPFGAALSDIRQRLGLPRGGFNH